VSKRIPIDLLAKLIRKKVHFVIEIRSDEYEPCHWSVQEVPYKLIFKKKVAVHVNKEGKIRYRELS